MSPTPVSATRAVSATTHARSHHRMPESLGSATVPPADLTVVVPTRDRPALLRRAVDSALAQAGASVEVVVVDDGSAEPVQLPGDPRLRVVRHAASRGGSAAGTGTTEGTGRFVTYLDDDDTLLPHLAARRCRPTPRRWSAARCSVFRR
jgi:hypothetical protein